ncbi:aldolase [Kribbella sp. ALI-6-A]|uniref:HpcH/HpaI aldolase family protein n=1 Tax=Kribbella sp. ALI-6-A TaxID=1933817 RepID=UPI00097C8140|nr:aldolase/citrate lyase family protein [Kribbella sp. ALI-6-A]ONI78482.1 aldolase [Kribbella sp. ALI-6-A]
MDNFAARLRAREHLVGYWVMLDAPPATERIARVGYDYVVLDAQHGLLSTRGILDGLMAIDAAAAGPVVDPSAGTAGSARDATVGLVRVEANNATPIGRALDAGAAGVIVPLVDSGEDAARAVRAAKYPPSGIRSFGPARSGLRIGPVPAQADAATVVLAMIETAAGLTNVEEICATPGLDGIYVGPSDLCLAVGGKFPGDPDVRGEFDAAVVHIAEVAAAAGVAAGIHTNDGPTAKRRLTEGYTFATVSSDLDHLQGVAADHLAVVRG